MSSLIQLIDQTEINNPESLKLLIKSIFRARIRNFKRVIENPTELIIYVFPSLDTYRLTTMWVFSFATINFKIQISIYNFNESDLIRAYTERMKIELSILIRMINQQITSNHNFILDHESGALKLQFMLQWSNMLQIASKKQNVIHIIDNLFVELNRYNDLILFVQPMFNFKTIQPEKNPYILLNRYRCLMNNTKNTRQKIQGCFFDLLRLKSDGDNLMKNAIYQIGRLYMDNVMCFQNSLAGLEQVSQFKIDSQIFEAQLRQKKKNQSGYTNLNKPKSIFTSQKLVFGILDLQADKNYPPKILSKEGGHSIIYKGLFKYKLYSTIYSGTVNLALTEKQDKYIEVKNELTYKVCSSKSSATVNSFKNELAVLRYTRDFQSPFIARYYLLVKESWNEDDTIYMNTYKQDLHSLFKNITKISLKTKLLVSYKICKGLCFFYSKQIAHRDFKPQNIVIDSYMTPKIIDFGSCVPHYKKQNFKAHDQRLLTTKGFHISYKELPREYEYIREKFSRRGYEQHPFFDIYGLGKTLSYIFFNSYEPPLVEQIITWPLFQLYQNILFLIYKCLQIDPDDRPGFGEIAAFLGSLKDLFKNVIQLNSSQQGIKNEDNQSKQTMQKKASSKESQ